MKTRKCITEICLIIGLFFSCQWTTDGGADTAPPPPVPPGEQEFVTNEIVIKASDTVPLAEIDSLINGFRKKHIGSFDGFSYYVYTIVEPTTMDM